MYSTVMGAKTARNRGVLYAITIGTHSTRKRHVNQAWKLIAIRVSITSMSLLKRFKIRPPGVLSKKDIGDATMFLKILKCTLRPALTLPMNNEILAAIINTPRNTNLFIYYCTFNSRQQSSRSLTKHLFHNNSQTFSIKLIYCLQ